MEDLSRAQAHRFVRPTRSATLHVATLVAALLACNSEESDTATPEPGAAAPAVAARGQAQAPATGNAAPAAATPSYQVGSNVQVLWKGKYYQAKILSKTGDKYRVHYVGWDSKWDETVTADRLKPAGQIGPNSVVPPSGPAAAAAPAPAPAPAAAPAPVAAAAPAVNEKGIPVIPTTRSNPPQGSEWDQGIHVNTQGKNSQAKDCTIRLLREWLQVTCRANITGYENEKDLGRLQVDRFESIKFGKLASFVIRLKPGHYPKVRICKNQTFASLFVSWPVGKDRPNHIALAEVNRPCDGGD